LQTVSLGAKTYQTQTLGEREGTAVGNVRIYKEVLSAYFDWLSYRGVRLQHHVKSRLDETRNSFLHRTIVHQPCCALLFSFPTSLCFLSP
jgi:hypothetical protein